MLYMKRRKKNAMNTAFFFSSMHVFCVRQTKKNSAFPVKSVDSSRHRTCNNMGRFSVGRIGNPSNNGIHDIHDDIEFTVFSLFPIVAGGGIDSLSSSLSSFCCFAVVVGAITISSRKSDNNDLMALIVFLLFFGYLTKSSCCFPDQISC